MTSKYTDKFLERCYKAILGGMTAKELSVAYRVSSATLRAKLSEWKKCKGIDSHRRSK